MPVGVDPALLPPPPPPEYIVIEPVEPDVYYVPIYDPYVVYGPWLWPAYAPFYWYPPGYVVGAAVIGFSVGFFVGSALWCHYNWGGGWGGHWGGPVTVNVVRYNQFNRTNFVAERNGFSNWQFNAAHRGALDSRTRRCASNLARGTICRARKARSRAICTARSKAHKAKSAARSKAIIISKAIIRSKAINRHCTAERDR